MTNLCRDCFHWIPPAQTRYAILHPLAGECRNGAVVIGEPESKIYLDDAERAPYLPCGPLFGCCHWEAK